jgi:hypothetical protein
MSVFIFFSGIDLCSAWNPVCIGMVYGVIGKVKVHPGKKIPEKKIKTDIYLLYPLQ